MAIEQDRSAAHKQRPRRLIQPKLNASGELGLVVAAVFVSVAYLLVGRGTSGVSFAGAVAFAAMAIPGCLIALLACGRFFDRISIVTGITLVMVSITAVIVATHFIAITLFDEPDSPETLLTRRLLFANVLIAYLLRQSFLKHRLKRRREAEQAAKIQALQSRIRPHFLFNSMNVIASLIPVNPDLAEQVVEDLSELFRPSLQEAGTFVRTVQELDLCNRYMHIESLRLGDRLTFEWRVDTPPGDAQMPLLILQPLLENAIYHGVQPLPEGGTVVIEVGFSENEMRARITNPLGPVKSTKAGDGSPGNPRQPHQGNHLAIANIRQRLEAVYGEKATLITTQKYNQFETTLRCPTVPKMI